MRADTIRLSKQPLLNMITISTEKGLIKVGDWGEILERPGFSQRLDRSKHELASILGRYVFPEKVHCGLSDCGTPHAKGYIVTTKDGRETNIGKDCGKKYFGVDFQVMANKFDRDMTEKENRELLWNFSFQIEELEERIAALRGAEKGVDWVYKRTQVLINPGPKIPLTVVRKMASLAKTKSNILSVSRLATEEEAQDQEAIQGRKLERPYYIEEQVARLVGVEALYSENDLRKMLVLDLEEPLKQVKGLNINVLSFEQLSKWKRWATSVEATLERAADVVGYGRELLTVKNLEPLLKILEKGDERDLFRSYLDTIREGV